MPEGRAWATAFVMGEKVYVAGGNTQTLEDSQQQVFQYDPSKDEWSSLPPYEAFWCTVGQFMGTLITVGGLIQDSIIGKVYRFIEESQNWEEFLKPMPTARYWPTLATTQSAIVASGGNIGIQGGLPVPCDTVEVYSTETSEWHTADPLPVPCSAMTSVTIADIWYQLGGFGSVDDGITTVLCAPLTSLIQKTTSPTHQSASPTSVWKTLPDTPLKSSAAANVNGNLLAVGGFYASNSVSPAVYMFLPDTNSWVRVTTGDLPVPRYALAAAQLSSSQVLVAGGLGENNNLNTKTVFMGSASS